MEDFESFLLRNKAIQTPFGYCVPSDVVISKRILVSYLGSISKDKLRDISDEELEIRENLSFVKVVLHLDDDRRGLFAHAGKLYQLNTTSWTGFKCHKFSEIISQMNRSYDPLQFPHGSNRYLTLARFIAMQGGHHEPRPMGNGPQRALCRLLYWGWFLLMGNKDRRRDEWRETHIFALMILTLVFLTIMMPELSYAPNFREFVEARPTQKVVNLASHNQKEDEYKMLLNEFTGERGNWIKMYQFLNIADEGKPEVRNLSEYANMRVTRISANKHPCDMYWQDFLYGNGVTMAHGLWSGFDMICDVCGYPGQEFPINYSGKCRNSQCPTVKGNEPEQWRIYKTKASPGEILARGDVKPPDGFHRVAELQGKLNLGRWEYEVYVFGGDGKEYILSPDGPRVIGHAPLVSEHSKKDVLTLWSDHDKLLVSELTNRFIDPLEPPKEMKAFDPPMTRKEFACALEMWALMWEFQLLTKSRVGVVLRLLSVASVHEIQSKATFEIMPEAPETVKEFIHIFASTGLVREGTSVALANERTRISDGSVLRLEQLLLEDPTYLFFSRERGNEPLDPNFPVDQWKPWRTRDYPIPNPLPTVMPPTKDLKEPEINDSFVVHIHNADSSWTSYRLPKSLLRVSGLTEHDPKWTKPQDVRIIRLLADLTTRCNQINVFTMKNLWLDGEDLYPKFEFLTKYPMSMICELLLYTHDLGLSPYFDLLVYFVFWRIRHINPEEAYRLYEFTLKRKRGQ